MMTQIRGARPTIAMITLLGLVALAMSPFRHARPVLAAPLDQAPVVAWSEPRIVWETTGRASSPILITDAWRQVHLFFLGQVEGEGENTLYHLDVDDPDAEPVDILVGVNEYRVAADPLGKIHVLVSGANNALDYTAVEAAEASDASAWSPAVSLGIANLGIDISADTAGKLHLCYPLDHGVTHQYSDDGGRNWSEPVMVAEMTDPTGVATYVRCVGDSLNVIHMAWAEARPPNFYPPEGVYYIRSADAGQSWTVPEQMAGQHYSLPTLLADQEDRVHLLWQGDVGVGGRFYRQRPAGPIGEWSPVETVVPAGQGGMSGDAGLALDSSGRLHAALAIDGIFWAARAESWTLPLDVSASLRDEPNQLNSIEQPALAIAGGNEIDVAFEFDFKRIYLLTGQSDAPIALQTPRASSDEATAVHRSATETMPSPPSSSPTPSPAPVLPSTRKLDAGGTTVGSNLPIVLGAGLAFLVVGGVVLARVRTRRP